MPTLKASDAVLQGFNYWRQDLDFNPEGAYTLGEVDQSAVAVAIGPDSMLDMVLLNLPDPGNTDNVKRVILSKDAPLFFRVESRPGATIGKSLGPLPIIVDQRGVRQFLDADASDPNYGIVLRAQLTWFFNAPYEISTKRRPWIQNHLLLLDGSAQRIQSLRTMGRCSTTITIYNPSTTQPMDYTIMGARRGAINQPPATAQSVSFDSRVVLDSGTIAASAGGGAPLESVVFQTCLPWDFVITEVTGVAGQNAVVVGETRDD